MELREGGVPGACSFGATVVGTSLREERARHRVRRSTQDEIDGRRGRGGKTGEKEIVSRSPTPVPAGAVPGQHGAIPGQAPPPSEAIQQPAKVLRIGAMARELLDEIRRAGLDEASRDKLSDTYKTSVRQLGELLSPELREELQELSLPLGDGVPSEAELRVAHAQLVGWLEGLFHGIQATLFAQQMENQARLAEMRRRALPGGEQATESGPGTYL